MDRSREFRDAASHNIRLPKEVYYRCLWTVRDSDRLRLAASVLDSCDRNAVQDGKSADSIEFTPSAGGDILITEETAGRAAFELECIGRAIEKIPEVYRKGLLDNIINKTQFDDFAHPNTWKRWKLVFLYELARELHII